MVRDSAKGYALFLFGGENMKTVTFCGHSKLYDDKSTLQNSLKTEIEKLILQGAYEFLLGGYGEFDILCAETVKELKNSYPHIKSVLVIPCSFP